MYRKQLSIDQYGRAWCNFNRKRKLPPGMDGEPQIPAMYGSNDRHGGYPSGNSGFPMQGKMTNAYQGANNYQLHSRDLQFAAYMEEKNNHMDQIRPDGRVQHLFQRRNDKEVANQFSLSVPERQVNPDASCFPFYSTEDRTVECTGIPSNSKGQGPSDGYSITKGHDPLSHSFFKKQQTSCPDVSEPFISPEGIQCSSSCHEKPLHAGAFDCGVIFPGANPHSSYGTSAQVHGLAQKNLKCQKMQPMITESDMLCLNTERNIHLKLPQDKFDPLNSATLKGSSAYSDSRVSAVISPLHPVGTQWVGSHKTEQNIHLQLASNQFYPVNSVALKGSSTGSRSRVPAVTDPQCSSGIQWVGSHNMEQKIHLKLPSDQSHPMNSVALKGSSTSFSSRVPAGTNPSHPRPTQWVGSHGTEQNIHLKLPSNQSYPMISVALRGSSTFPSSRDLAVTNPSHPNGTQWVGCQNFEQNTHLELPSNQSYPINSVALRGSSTCSCSRVPAVTNPSHPNGTQWVGCQNFEQNTHLELPSNQLYPLNYAALNGSPTCPSSRVSAVTVPLHPTGTQWVSRQIQRPGPHSLVSNWSICGECTVTSPSPKGLKTGHQFGPSSKYGIPQGERLPKLQFYPESPVDSHFPAVQSITNNNDLFPALSGVQKNPVNDSAELNRKNDVSPSKEIFGMSSMGIMNGAMVENLAELNHKQVVSPLEEIFGTSNMGILDNTMVETLGELNHRIAVSPLEEIFNTSNMGAMDVSMDEALADSSELDALFNFNEPTPGCQDGKQVGMSNVGIMDGGMVETLADSGHLKGLLKELTLACQEGEQVMEDASKLDLEAVYSIPEKVTVAPNMDNIVSKNQDLATDEDLFDSSGLRSERVPIVSEQLNPCFHEERQSGDLDDKGSESKQVLSEGIHKEVHKVHKVPIAGGRRTTAVSLIEYFTREQIEEHLSGLKKLSSQILLHDRETDTAHTTSEKPCELCGEPELLFAPASIYCMKCYKIIKLGSDYYASDEGGEELLDGEGQKYFCLRCGRNSKLVKRKHDERKQEPWVLCDSCGAWHHQICGLYNNKMDTAENAEYICPICCLKSVDGYDRTTFRDGCTFSAKDLPRTMLSDHIEQRLYNRLKQEREDRAKASGKNIHEVPAAENLVVRVVSSVSEKVEVNKQFVEIFRLENYPSELPYKSKVIALFQMIEGVDVFLFGMYVQEYGTDCSHPNKRSVYISYLDSVKYFHPDIKSAYEESLRTFVYHEILIGYLEYCKKRGFASCYLWVCPPVKGDDFLFHCHPQCQKNLPRKGLLKWYQKLFSRAADEKIVLSSTNLYKHYFIPSRGHKFKISAAQLPYFEGDHWPSKLERFLGEINQKPVELIEQKDKSMPKRAIKGCKNLSTDSTTDILLMQKIEQSMQDKNEFMVAHLQHICTCCHEVILSGKRWFCNLCKNFQLCQSCAGSNEAGEASEEPPVCREKHLLSQATVNSVSEDTEDGDITIKNRLFERRRTFLNFCKKNNYQFDTLRRAKYSSMMILYHLNEHGDQITGSACSLCHGEILAPGRKCKICLEFHVCKACYTRQDFSHCHELTPASPADDPLPDTQFKRSGSVDLKDVLSLLVHSSQCSASENRPCPYLHCPKIKGLFHHSIHCSLGGASGGCECCQNVWLVLRLHAKDCKALDCGVPWCRRLKGRPSKRPVKREHSDRGIHHTPVSA